ncbi:MAG: hypothetical protein IH616_05560 [Gemmatimonadales bacterium]|nr:hypothetical protein [Gemmatimonadales bacterium]
MFRSVVRAAAVAMGLLGLAAPLHAQGYQIRWDNWLQSTAYRGVTLDSILASDAVIGDGGGAYSPDGVAVRCLNGAEYCTYFGLGQETRAAPVVSTLDASVWGFGVPGLKLHVKGRLGTDLTDGGFWPGTSPTAQLLEGYAEYSNPLLTAQAGRTNVYSRLGFWGLDGGQVTVRPLRGRLQVSAYGGWALAQAAVLPVTSADLNPLGDYRPESRELIFGGSAGWSIPAFEGRVLYQRLIDPGVDETTSDRGAFEAAVRPGGGFTASGGAEYDFGQGLFGTHNVQVTYQDPGSWVRVVAGQRHYRPVFPLWSIWGVFSPSAHDTWYGALALYPIPGLELRTRGESYSYDPAGGASPSLNAEDSGWRWAVGGTYAGFRLFTVDAHYSADYGPGASSQGVNGRITVTPLPQVTVALHGGYLERPLEYRYWDAKVMSYGARVDFQPVPGISANAGVIRYDETRERPDAGRAEWDHVRFTAGLTFVFGSAGHRSRGLHPAILRIPEMRRSR